MFHPRRAPLVPIGLVLIGITMLFCTRPLAPRVTDPSESLPATAVAPLPVLPDSSEGERDPEADSINAIHRFHPGSSSAFDRGRNQELTLLEPRVREISAEAHARPPISFTHRSADGRDQPTAAETEGGRLHSRRMGWKASALAQVIEGQRGRLRVPLPEGGELDLRIEQVQRRATSSHTLLGKIEGLEELSEVMLVHHDGVLRGSVADYRQARTFEYRSLDPHHLIVQEIDRNAVLPPCGTCDPELAAHDHPKQDPGARFRRESSDATDVSEGPGHSPPSRSVAMEVEFLSQQGALAASTPIPPPSGGSLVHQIDILVGYGKRARQAEGGVAEMEARIIAAVDRMNVAFDRSDIHNARLNLLGTIEDPRYVFPGRTNGSQHDELSDLGQTGPNNPALNTVSDFAILIGADLMCFVILEQQEGSAGLASGSANGTSIVGRSYMNTHALVFCHEIGHNLSAWHAWGDTIYDTHPNSRNYGWRLYPAVGSRILAGTIMAYGNHNSLLNFSNPEVLYQGSRTGQYRGYNAAGDPNSDQSLVSGGRANIDPEYRTGFDGSNPRLGAMNAQVIREYAEQRSQYRTRTLSLTMVDPASEYFGIADEQHGLRLEVDSKRYEAEHAAVVWEHVSGPGSVQFADEAAQSTTAFFSDKGAHELKVTATEGSVQLTERLRVDVGAYEPPTLPEPEIGWWKLDEGSGTLAIDSTTPANHGTLSGFTGDPWSAGYDGGALLFGDRSDFITIPDSDELDGMTQVTFTCWVNPATEDDEWRGLIGKNVRHDVDESYAIYLGPLNRIWIKLDDHLRLATAVLPASEWTHVAVAFDGSAAESERMRIYINGVLDSEHPVELNRIVSTNSPLYLGSLQGTGVNGHNGLLDDVRLYNRALSAEEVGWFADRPPNYGPEISLAVASHAVLGQPHPLSASVLDDGLPGPSSLRYRWSVQDVDILNSSAPATLAAFETEGTYLIQFEASDGEVTTLKTLAITVDAMGGDDGMPGGPRNYQQWSSSFDWQGRDPSPASVDNVHGLPNLLLFAMDLHPLAIEVGLSTPRLTPGVNGGPTTFRFRRNTQVESLLFYPKTSGDLVRWEPIDGSNPDITLRILDSDVDGDGSAELVEVEVHNRDRQFFKLHSELP